MNGQEDDSIRILKQPSPIEEISSVNSTGRAGSNVRRFASISNVLTSFGNFNFNEEVKSECLSSVKEVIEGNVIFLHLWNDVLIILCIIATSLDPLFCYILLVDEDRKCIGFDKKLRLTIVVLRSLIDFVYIILIVFHFRIGYISPYDEDDRGGCAKAWKYFLSYLTVDILAVLPLPQVVILIVIPKLKGSGFTIAMRSLKFVLMIQYLPRVFRVYSFLKKVRWSSGILPDSAGAKAVFNLFLYMLASHVFGAFWYLFSVERKATCWQQNGQNHSHTPLNCNYNDRQKVLTDASCSGKESNDTAAAFDFGIFGDAFKSGVVHSSDFIWKVSYCYWWGLQNLSSLGQSLKTSKHIWEIYFAVVITISGLILFALLIGNLQTFLQATIARLEEMRLKGKDIELWMGYHSLPRDLKKRIKRYEKYKWRETRGVDVENILDNLPRDIRQDTTRHLCLGAITKVPMLENMDDKFLDAVCGLIKPVLYIEHNFVVREGEPLDEMIFIIRGRLWIYSNMNAEASGSSSSEGLNKGDYYGENLLHWVLQYPFLSTVPISTKTVRTHTKVEAFVLRASDLKSVVSKFWWLFSRERRNDPHFKERWAPWAALVLQAAWRHYLRSKHEKEKSQLVTEGRNSECLGTTTTTTATNTTIIASRFIARALRALKRSRKSSDLPESSRV